MPRLKLFAGAAALAVGTTLALTIPGATAAPAAAAPTTTLVGYAAALTPGDDYGRGFATLRKVTTGSETYWQAGVRGAELQEWGTSLDYEILVTTSIGRRSALHVCTLAINESATGSCTGRVSMPAGVVKRLALLTSTGDRPQVAAEGFLGRRYGASMDTDEAAGNATIRKVFRGDTTYWRASARMRNLSPDTQYTYGVTFYKPGASPSEYWKDVCSFTAGADGSGGCVGRVAWLPSAGVARRVARIDVVVPTRGTRPVVYKDLAAY